jgi:hypothetical protein
VESDGSNTGVIPSLIKGFDDPLPTVATLILGLPAFVHAFKKTLAA